MHNFKKGLLTLAATAAVLAPAAPAVANTSTSSSAASFDCLALCKFSVLDDNNVEVVKDVNALNAVNVCPNVSLVQVTAFALGQVADCSNGAHSNYKKVKRTW
jgi:hypothetical protein